MDMARKCNSVKCMAYLENLAAKASPPIKLSNLRDTLFAPTATPSPPSSVGEPAFAGCLDVEIESDTGTSLGH